MAKLTVVLGKMWLFDTSDPETTAPVRAVVSFNLDCDATSTPMKLPRFLVSRPCCVLTVGLPVKVFESKLAMPPKNFCVPIGLV